MLAEAAPVYESVPGLLISLAFIPVCGIALMMTMKWMFSGELDVLPGLSVVMTVLLIAIVTITSKSFVLAGIVFVVMITLMMFFPYALDQLASADLRGMEIDQLDKAHKEISQNPNNIPTYFLIADIVYSLGLEGHAVSIAEQTLSRLSNELDPIKNASIRDAFRSEELKAKEWRRQIRDSSAFRAVACPRCHKMNESGVIACSHCNGPFLLDIARTIDPRQKIRSKLVLSWALVAGFFTGIVTAWFYIDGVFKFVVLFIGLGLVGLTMYKLFRHRTLRD